MEYLPSKMRSLFYNGEVYSIRAKPISLGPNRPDKRKKRDRPNKPDGFTPLNRVPFRVFNWGQTHEIDHDPLDFHPPYAKKALYNRLPEGTMPAYSVIQGRGCIK
jgi:hypothetical protein